ncbi:hypothetical protein JCGZ_05489 [Jatropha curcas]|uniref:Uncharacterized protein n=1 Tax=Jatropha curcas TaxID=180498 RepID=A0A067L6G9_JATCU|nr:hypothetical protein JCGZ_05489 [Jatropha curcas]
MRFIGVVLVLSLLMSMSCCWATDMKSLTVNDVEMEEEEHRKVVEGNHMINNGDFPATSVNNHHYIPRQDFGSFGGDSGNCDTS